MRLADVRVDRVEKAIEIYLDHAYGRGAGKKRAPSHNLAPDAPPEDVLRMFQREVCEGASGTECVRYTMRLGNRNYPFMKLVLQEHIVEGEYYFVVDTHDHMDIKPSYPDYEAWQVVRRFNNDLKRQIERSFAEADLPTASCIRAAVDCRDRAEVEQRDELVLVVDDEDDLAHAVVGLLESRGFRTAVADDGPTAIAKARELRPDLVLLDYELPEMDGLEVLTELRKADETKATPVLLCTASRITVEEIARADGFLSKPFQESLLQEMVERLIGNAVARRERAS
jgi:CheY-like chemotaxis protein